MRGMQIRAFLSGPLRKDQHVGINNTVRIYSTVALHARWRCVHSRAVRSRRPGRPTARTPRSLTRSQIPLRKNQPKKTACKQRSVDLLLTLLRPRRPRPRPPRCSFTGTGGIGCSDHTPPSSRRARPLPM